MTRRRETKRKAARRRRTSDAGGLVLIVAVAVVLSCVVKTVFVQAFYIPSPSMERTLQKGDRILVNKLSEDDIQRGDVVVFEDPGHWLEEEEVETIFTLLGKGFVFLGLVPDGRGNLVKRVIGVPGDSVRCCDARGRVQVNGKSIAEPYVYPGYAPSQKMEFFDIHVPPGHLWVLGDNRANSADSR